jgi:hypothetical protein
MKLTKQLLQEMIEEQAGGVAGRRAITVGIRDAIIGYMENEGLFERGAIPQSVISAIENSSVRVAEAVDSPGVAPWRAGGSTMPIMQEARSERKPNSQVKPWESALVFFDKNAGAPPIPPSMVRVKATLDTKWTGNLKKNYQQNNIVLKIMQDTIDLKGNHSAQSIHINVNGKFVEPDEQGRFWDIDSWLLKKKGLTDKYSNLLDNQGHIVASKKQQNKWSGAS